MAEHTERVREGTRGEEGGREREMRWRVKERGSTEKKGKNRGEGKKGVR